MSIPASGTPWAAIIWTVSVAWAKSLSAPAMMNITASAMRPPTSAMSLQRSAATPARGSTVAADCMAFLLERVRARLIRDLQQPPQEQRQQESDRGHHDESRVHRDAQEAEQEAHCHDVSRLLMPLPARTAPAGRFQPSLWRGWRLSPPG